MIRNSDNPWSQLEIHQVQEYVTCAPTQRRRQLFVIEALFLMLASLQTASSLGSPVGSLVAANGIDSSFPFPK